MIVVKVLKSDEFWVYFKGTATGFSNRRYIGCEGKEEFNCNYKIFVLRSWNDTVDINRQGKPQWDRF